MKPLKLCLLLVALTGILVHHSPAQIATKTVPCIADLKSVDPAAFPVVHVLDYYTNRSDIINAPNSRRGGGTFRWVTDETDPQDGGILISSTLTNAGIWERVLNGEVPNVKMWGATGGWGSDGAAPSPLPAGYVDDTDAFTRAFTYVSRVGYRLLIPSGIYKVTNSIVIPDLIHLEGEGNWFRSLIVMSGANKRTKDIFRTVSAHNALVGGLKQNPNAANALNSNNQSVDYAAGLVIQNVSFLFGFNGESWEAGARQGAAILLAQPGEGSAIRNIHCQGGGFGIRAIGGGTPGLKVEHCSFFSQELAGICVEGYQYFPLTSTSPAAWSGTAVWAAVGGPITLTDVSGDEFNGANASLVLFSNYFPNVTITDMAVEGHYAKGVIRTVMPPGATWPFGQINVIGGTFGTLNTTDLVVLSNPHSTTTVMPHVTLNPKQSWNADNLINDEWTGRKIKALRYNTQLPLSRPIHYRSGISQTEECAGVIPAKRTLLVIGDTAYYSFIPTTANRWYRVALTYPSAQMMGGRMAINGYWDSSEFSFNSSILSSQIDIHRKSKGANVVVKNVRGYTFMKGFMHRQAIDIFVGTPLPSEGYTEQQRQIVLTMPIEGNLELGTGIGFMCDPLALDDSNSANTFPSTSDTKLCGETYALTGNSPTTSLSLIRP